VAHHGAGLRLKAKASHEAIARAVGRVLDEPSFAANAQRLAAAIAAETARDQAVEELELLASRDATVLPERPYGASIQDSPASSVLS
jgi:UDP:flavonoid glycosyltransferase YjiC (YdhE family)